MTDLTASQPVIAIVGGGFSGSLVAAHLLRNATAPLTIKLIEPNPQIARGVAYQHQVPCHLLNVPAGKMSALADEPAHFLNWLHRNGQKKVTASTFVPRQIYGDYVQALLNEAKAQAKDYVRLERIIDEAIAIETPSLGAKVYLKSGQSLLVEKVVLALGNFPASLPEAIAQIENRDRYIRDGWSAEATWGLNPEDSVLLVGTGLTMADVVVTLRQQGFPGQIHAVSRHGLMPHSHKVTFPYPAFIDGETAPQTTRVLLHRLRQEVLSAESQGQDWRAVLDALRPFTPQLWQGLPLKEQKRFLRHLKAYWEVHRHRVAPEIARNLQAAIQSGQLKHYAGRIQSCRQLQEGIEVTVQERGSHRELVLPVNRIINCTGSSGNYSQHPLMLNLQQQGLSRPNALSLGIDTAANGALLDAQGTASQQLYTLGPPRKGDLWETTAVAEIRVQAANLAQELWQSLTVEGSLMRNSAIALGKPGLFFRQLFDRESYTYTYLIADLATKAAILVDPVWEQVERDLQILRELKLTLRYCLETHIHADHITGTGRLTELTGCLAILPEKAEVAAADRYLGDGKELRLGSVEIRAIATPGHTNEHTAYLVNGTHLLTGDALFIRGCGRTDFQNGDAGLLYDSVTRKLFALPDETLVYPGHDYQGRTVSTIGEEKCWNPRFVGRTRHQFIELMNNLNLPKPQKMMEAVPANQRCGKGLVA